MSRLCHTEEKHDCTDTFFGELAAVCGGAVYVDYFPDERKKMKKMYFMNFIIIMKFLCMNFE